MIQNRKQYKDAMKLLRELRFESKLLERKMRILRPKRSVDEQCFEKLKIAILEIEKEIDLYDALKAGLVVLDFADIHRSGKTLIMGRITAGLTQAQLAERAGMNRQMLIRYEQALYENAPLKQIRKVAAGLESAIATRFSRPPLTNSMDKCNQCNINPLQPEAQQTGSCTWHRSMGR